ncbi:Hsp70 family protein [Nocardia sp. CA-129566]|uniref:Hsp70 family protein n=1 Tax=Nocardia sp. CA-129566 TaxID=3239976 RepID=UPI003D981A17
MTERLALGINVGAANSVAVATAGDGSDFDRGHSGGTVITHPSVLRLTPEAAPAFGDGARPTGRHSNDVVLEGFLARVGDPVDILAEDGTAHSAADLVATAVDCLIAESGADAAQSTVACHPAWWSRHTVDVQRAALDRAGLREVTLVPEPTAAARWLEAAHGPLGDGAVVVYDLGASGLTVSVVRTGVAAAVLGAPLRTTDVAGAEFDLLTMRYVLANALRGNDFDPFDPVVERELSALRDRCRYAKEELSTNTATVVPVRLNPADHDAENIRLVRGELEDLLRGPLLTSIDLIRDAIHRAGLDIGDIGRVLLTGGGGAIPLVAELVSTEFGLPVVAAPEPKFTSALGAAELAADLLSATVDRTPVAAMAVGIAKTTEFPTVPRRVQPPPAPNSRMTGRTPADDNATVPNQTLPKRRDRSRRRLSGRQRAAIIAGAALILGALATGTVAIGTGAQPGPNRPTSPDPTTAPGAAVVAVTNSGNTSDTATTSAKDSPAGTTDKPKPVAGQSSSPATNTAAAVNGQSAPVQTTDGQPAQSQPAQSQPTQSQPAPAAQPTTEAPAPQPQPTTQPQSTPQPIPQPQVPTVHLPLPTDTIPLGDTVPGVVSALPKIPGGR